MMRRLDGASKDMLKRLANGPLGDGKPGGLGRALAGLMPMDVRDPLEAHDAGAATNIVAHLGEEESDAATPD
jgi:hypothetical protein